MPQLPSSVHDVTPEWLGDVLAASGTLGAGDAPPGPVPESLGEGAVTAPAVF